MAMSMDALAVILLHEWKHVALNHIARRESFLKEYREFNTLKSWQTAFNIGSDLEVNSMLQEDLLKAGLADTAILPGMGSYAGLPAGLTAEQYARRIMCSPELHATIENQNTSNS